MHSQAVTCSHMTSTMLVLALRVLLCYLLVTVQANTEKVIFLGPSRITIPNISPGLEQLQLNALSPSRNKLETQLPVKFPTDEEPRGTQHWYLIEGLEEGRRYEVRICWVATVCPPRSLPPWRVVFIRLSASSSSTG